MPDFRQQIRDHFDAQQLPAAKVDAILVAGRAARASEPTERTKVVEFDEGRRAVRWPLRLCLAAALVLFAGLAFWWPRRIPAVSFAVLAPRIVEFFGTPPELPKRSQNPVELHAWLLAQGAPVDFQIPEKLRSLESLGCQVVDVRGRPAYLTCFWRDGAAGSSERALVHLFVVHPRDFREAPAGSPQFRELDGWSFASWSQGGAIYTMATAAPLETLRKFVLRWIVRESRLASREELRSVSS